MLVDSLKAAAKHMMIDYEEVSAKIKHNGEKGTSREEIMVSYLRKYIPDKYIIGRGTILDSSGQQSRQQDCIIYDSFSSPVLLNMESTKMIPIESVYAIIEIKSSLNKDKLIECIENIRSVRSLSKQPLTSIYSATAGFVFSYTSETSLETLLGNVVELNKKVDIHHQISTICVLDKGLIVNVDKDGLNSISPIPTPNSTPAIINNPTENNLIIFYLMIMQYLNQTIVSPPNLMKYVEKEIASKIQLVIPKQHIPSGSSFEFEGRRISVDNVMILVNDMERFKKILSGEASSDEIMSYFGDNIDHLNKFTEDAMGGKSSTFEWFGKVYDMKLLVDVFKIYSTEKKGEELSNSLKEKIEYLKEELFKQYRKSYEKPGIVV